MKAFSELCIQAQNLHPELSLEAMLGPGPRSPEELIATPDDRLFSDMTRRIFRAGLKHSLVDSKWPAFETAFFGFDPYKVSLLSDEQIEKMMQNEALIRHLGKLKAARANALLVSEISEQKGGLGRFLAEWPVTDIVSLWTLLKKEGTQLGGNSGASFLRMVGKDTFMLTDDVVTALRAQGVVDKKPTAQRDLKLVQEAFNAWHAESGKPMCQISRLLAHSIGRHD
ncbi:DNA-3-methyladenine glycosylase I [Marinobacterium mangrovicola]|uniref:DNA-3-methyladenine glycosylase I n=1 Tax=Marinobacterium mangrovicola TaxID=1476959 RepID=A0A4R1G7K3_9GAMM|nr:DNA-3-methyladenine glycosylase I [Marinobacterium mangrovicola]TCK02533.1 DNA-3-methyladenine glycosylase I [Marinobacterium mangrovicola]